MGHDGSTCRAGGVVLDGYGSESMYNMEDSPLTVKDTGNRAEWRRRIRVADPHPRDSQPEGERERDNESVYVDS